MALTDKGKQFIIDTALLILSEQHNELECRRQILNFMMLGQFTDEDIEGIEAAIKVERQKQQENPELAAK